MATTTVTLTDSQRHTLRYAQLDQLTTECEIVANKAAELRDMREEDPSREFVTDELLSGMGLLRDDLDALEALLREEEAR